MLNEWLVFVGLWIKSIFSNKPELKKKKGRHFNSPHI